MQTEISNRCTTFPLPATPWQSCQLVLSFISISQTFHLIFGFCFTFSNETRNQKEVKREVKDKPAAETDTSWGGFKTDKRNTWQYLYISCKL